VTLKIIPYFFNLVTAFVNLCTVYNIFVITSTSEHKEESARFLNFYLNSIEANKLLRADRGVPSSSVVREALVNEMDPEVIQNFEFIGKVGQVALPNDPISPPGMGEFNSLITELAELVSFNQISPGDAAARLINEGNEILSRAAS